MSKKRGFCPLDRHVSITSNCFIRKLKLVYGYITGNKGRSLKELHETHNMDQCNWLKAESGCWSGTA